MPSIALIHSGKSFMPEIRAYQNYFEQIGLSANILLNPLQFDLEPFDILWFFMGIQYGLNEVNRKKIIIHEYCSASTPPLARLKDLIKKMINAKPNLRISLLNEHRGSVYPNDEIPGIIRKQGVHSCFFEKNHGAKEYDFIYTGSALKVRNTGKWLPVFTEKFPDKSILLVGNHESRIVKKFSSNTHIHFKKPVPVHFLPALLAKAHYAVNYVPDVYPFNLQPSTKLLEYCAAGCRIISNSYEWVAQFEVKKQAGIFFMDENFSNLSVSNLKKIKPVTSDMSEYKWEHIFKEMQLHRFLPV